jgi:hypothetical protein
MCHIVAGSPSPRDAANGAASRAAVVDHRCHRATLRNMYLIDDVGWGDGRSA